MTTFVFALQRVGAFWSEDHLPNRTHGKAACAQRRALTGTC